MGAFEKSFKKELGKNTAKWLSNKIFGDEHATPYKIITKNDNTRREKETLRSVRENQLQKQQYRKLREKERIQEDKLRNLEEEKEAREEIKRIRREEVEQIANEKHELIESKRREVNQFNEYINTIQTFHTRSSDVFNWEIFTKKPDLLSIFNENVSKIKFFSECDTLDSLKQRHYSTYVAFTSGGVNVINCLSVFLLRLEINPTKTLFRNGHYDFNIFIAFLNDEQIIELFKNQYENQIEKVEVNLKELNNKLKGYEEKLTKLHCQKEEYQSEINNNNWIKDVFNKRKSKLTESISLIQFEINDINNKQDDIKKSYEYFSLNKILNEYNDYIDTLRSIDIIWHNSLQSFKEKKEMYYLSNNLLENKDYKFFEIAEKNFEPFSFGDDLNITIITNYKKVVHEIDVYVNGKDVIPDEELYLVREKDIKSRPLPKKRFWEIYQDYVSSVTLRVANEYFSFFSMRKEVIIRVYSEVLDISTGIENTGIIIEVKINRSELESVNLQFVDPSSCLSRFNFHSDYDPNNGYSIIRNFFESENKELNIFDLEISNVEESAFLSVSEDDFCQIMDYLIKDKQTSTSYFQRKLKMDYESAGELKELLKESNLIVEKNGSTIVNLDNHDF